MHPRPLLNVYIKYFQLYSQVLTSEVVLYNSGKVDMDFATLGVSDKLDLAPGEISVQPATVCQIQRRQIRKALFHHVYYLFQGHIPALDNMTLTIHFLPGVPEIFKKVFQVHTCTCTL